MVHLKDNSPLSTSELKVYFGGYDGKSFDPALIYDVADVRHHPGFNNQAPADAQRAVHDIAILKLSRAAPTPFRSVKILRDSAKIKAGQKVSIVGYGNIYFFSDANEPKSRLLRSFEWQILNPRGPLSGTIEFFRPKEITSLEDLPKVMGGMAAGDSGGPSYIVIDGVPYLIGVASGYRGENEVPS